MDKVRAEMPPERNKQFYLRARIADKSKPPLVVVPITLADPAVVEIIGFAGAEAVLLDSEHGMMGPETIRSMFSHAQAAGVPAIFRPRSFDAAACRQALDQGVAGVHVSHIDSADQALAVVDACRYSPLGHREMSLGRAVKYNTANISAYVGDANNCQLIVIMIESVTAVENVESIASVPGIDVIHMGIADLSHSMGLTGDYHHPDVNAAVERVLAAAHKYGVAVGYPTQDPEKVEHWAAKGVRFFEADTPDYSLRELYAKNLSILNDVFSKLAIAQKVPNKSRT